MSAAASALLLFRDLAPPGTAASFRDPVHLVTATTLDAVRPALERVEALTGTGLHAVGYISYEAGPGFDAALVAQPPGALPLLQFALYPPPRTVPLAPAGAAEPPAWICETSAEEHATAVRTIREAIADGGVYQVNLTTRFRAVSHGDPFALFQGMHARQRGDFGAWLDFGRFAVGCASPELFVARRGATAVSRPMKGTAPRGRWHAEDAERAAALAASPKERAENVMIVDLVRNDLGRLALPGSVRVPSLYAVEPYPSVWQMTSTVEAELPAGTTTAALIAALFPCGSITGAPKIAASRMIAELERSPRGAYCGIVGHMAPGGDATFAVAIRTATFDRVAGTVEYGAGGGITWDSEAGAEHEELLAKAAIATAPWPRFELLETLRVEAGRPVRLERHTARMARSAGRFRVPLDEGAVRSAAEAAAASAGTGRLRLLADDAGRVRAEIAPLPGTPAEPPRVALAAAPVDSRDLFLYHKTTHRAVYDSRRAERPDLYDVLLRNEAGHLTEFTTGNLVLELDGARVTPPVGDGLLAGVFRDTLLDAGSVTERTLVPGDLDRATAIWLVNSVREWLPVRLAPPRLAPGHVAGRSLGTDDTLSHRSGHG